MNSETSRLPPTVRHFTQLLSSTRRRARLALALDAWGTDPFPPRGKTVWAELDVRDG